MTEREVAIMNEAFMVGRVYANLGEKESPADIQEKLIKKCELKANAVGPEPKKIAGTPLIINVQKDFSFGTDRFVSAGKQWSTQLEALTDTPRPLWKIKSISNEEVVLEAGNQTIVMNDPEWIREFIEGGAEQGMSVELEVD